MSHDNGVHNRVPAFCLVKSTSSHLNHFYCFCQFLSQDFGPHQLELLMAGSQSMTFTSANPTVLQVSLSRVGSKKDTILDITDINIGKNPKNRKLWNAN